MEPWKRILLVILVTLTILSLLLSACGPIDKNDNRKDNDKGKNEDKGNDDDNKMNGNDDQNDGPKADKVLICHKTGSAKNPYVLISVSENALKNGHGKHAGDIIPAPNDGCPESWITTDVPAK